MNEPLLTLQDLPPPKVTCPCIPLYLLDTLFLELLFDVIHGKSLINTAKSLSKYLFVFYKS